MENQKPPDGFFVSLRDNQRPKICSNAFSGCRRPEKSAPYRVAWGFGGFKSSTR
jgi:hypothetical protein